MAGLFRPKFRLSVLCIVCLRRFTLWRSLLTALMLTLIWTAVAEGQSGVISREVPAPPQTIETALRQMFDKAGIIFVGQVTAVRRPDGGGANAASGWVEIEFRVDQAVRGCSSGGTYTLREWAGLWGGGDQRYRIGRQLLMLLYAPGTSGMSSPVDGLDGAIPIVRSGTVPLASSSSARLAPPAVDLRWVGAKLLRSVPYGSISAAIRQTGQTVRNHPMAVPGTGSAVAEGLVTEHTGSASIPAQQASVDLVLGMFRAWKAEQKVQDAAR